MSDNASFELSRVYASGWTAGSKWTNTDPDDVQGVSDHLNPYQLPIERERWEQGFKASISRFWIKTAAGKTKSKTR